MSASAPRRAGRRARWPTVVSAPDPPYVVRPARVAGLFGTLCLGWSGAALAVHPHDRVPRVALLVAVVVSVLMGALLLTGAIRVRRVGDPPGSPFGSVVPVAAYVVAADVVGREHDLVTRTAVGVDALGLAVIAVGLWRTRGRRPPAVTRRRV